MYILMAVDIKYGYDIIVYWNWLLVQLYVSFIDILVTSRHQKCIDVYTKAFLHVDWYYNHNQMIFIEGRISVPQRTRIELIMMCMIRYSVMILYQSSWLWFLSCDDVSSNWFELETVLSACPLLVLNWLSNFKTIVFKLTLFMWTMIH